jgi:hypothetical protein
VTVRAILGLVLLNTFLLAVGVGLLFGLRGWRTWGEFARLSGLAYFLGLGGTCAALVLELIVRVPFSLATILLTGIVLGGAGAALGRRLGRHLPPRARNYRVPVVTLVSAVAAGVTIVYLEALFRSGRLAPLLEFDPWAFWVPKAKAISSFGGLDPQFFHDLSNSSYPPLLPTLEAMAFRFMGAQDVVTLHLQFWFLLAGFAAAVVGLLPARVPPLLRWAPLLLVLVTPHVVGHALQPQADLLLDEAFALAALLVALWLRETEWWQLAAAGLLLAVVVLTKRDGYLLAAVVIVAPLVATRRDARRAWPPIGAMAAFTIALAVPWRVFLSVRGLDSGAPPGGATGFLHHLDRGWPALRLTVTTLFDYDVWLVVTPLALLAIALAFLAGARRLPAFAALVYVLAALGFTWVSWSYTNIAITEDLAINPIVRLTGSLALFSAALVPLLLEAAWRGHEETP